jgi:hypothetical protein
MNKNTAWISAGAYSARQETSRIILKGKSMKKVIVFSLGFLFIVTGFARSPVAGHIAAGHDKVYILDSFSIAKGSDISKACAKKVVDAVNSNKKLNQFVMKNANADLEWSDEKENSITATVTSDDSNEGNLRATFAVEKTADGCKVGKLLTSDFSL